MKAEYSVEIGIKRTKEGGRIYRARLLYHGFFCVARSDWMGSREGARLAGKEFLENPAAFITMKAQAKIDEAKAMWSEPKPAQGQKGPRFINKCERFGPEVEVTLRFYLEYSPRANFVIQPDGIYQQKSGSGWERVADVLPEPPPQPAPELNARGETIEQELARDL